LLALLHAAAAWQEGMGLQHWGDLVLSHARPARSVKLTRLRPGSQSATVVSLYSGLEPPN
jgi:hypothetical protein